MKAVTQAKIKHLQSLLLTEYTSYADTSSIPGHYVLFWELKSRHDNGPPKLDEKMMEDFALRWKIVWITCTGGSSVNQYKTPRCVKSGGALQILDSRVIGRFFSKRVPQWESLGLDS
ncbi:unnamed protein product [Microthlaspi erraticum]|uniref:GH3 C-terminal domain-containing protein n=1 Tax=Microthlaspi erraticum TaxID=1685480 RepID=A0A6D2HRS6_9BRAS|nr:unnamed protein product [Microthlaspi erraticum]